MTLIKSISGIRGTIGGEPGKGLSPIDIVKFVSAYSAWLKSVNNTNYPVVIVGRDARISGEMLNRIVVGTLCGYGINVIDLGLATTPTVEIAVANENAQGGIILTASHNLAEWNALKLLNNKGEFISAAEGQYILTLAAKEKFVFSDVSNLGSVKLLNCYEDHHIDMILKLPFIDTEAIKNEQFTVAIDSINSVGGIVLPKLLKKLGVDNIIELNGEPTGIFSHNPEPLPDNIGELVEAVTKGSADVGFVVDPDVDRLAIVSEDGSLFNEEYTLVACADYVLSVMPGTTVSNMSSTRALRDVAQLHGCKWHASAVGEVNVVAKMKELNAVIGGEGNGGIIYPELHYGRDALVGIALFLSHLAKSGLKCSELRKKYPYYYISKNKFELKPNSNPDSIIKLLSIEYSQYISNSDDGILIEKTEGWIQVRKSNTEAIIRIYSEGRDKATADALSAGIIESIKKLL